MERRLQLLLDQERYDRVAAEADRSGRSVAAVIREAIDFRFPDDDDARRARAAQAFLDLPRPADQPPTESPAELKRIYDAYLDEKFTRLGL